MAITLTLPRLLTLPPTIFLYSSVFGINSKVLVAGDGCRGDFVGGRSVVVL